MSNSDAARRGGQINSKYLGSTPFSELLPSSIAGDASIRAMAEALDSVLKPSAAGLNQLLIFARLHQADTASLLPPLRRAAELNAIPLPPLSGELLDALAWQYHVDAYDAALDEDIKREMLLRSLLLHRRKGTPWAVRTALSIVLSRPVSVREWFDYGGKPYFFRIGFDVSDTGMDDAMLSRISVTLFEQKNVRSWLECIETINTRGLPYRVGLACATTTTGGADLWMPTHEAPDLNKRTGMVVDSHSISVIQPF